MVRPCSPQMGADVSHHGGSAYPGVGDYSQASAKSGLLEKGSGDGDYGHKVLTGLLLALRLPTQTGPQLRLPAAVPNDSFFGAWWINTRLPA